MYRRLGPLPAAQSPLPCIRFESFIFVDTFNYAAGILVGKGSWTADSEFPASPLILSAGNVRDGHLGGDVSTAADSATALASINLAKPFVLEYRYTKGSSSATFSTYGFVMNTNTGGYIWSAVEVHAGDLAFVQVFDDTGNFWEADNIPNTPGVPQVVRVAWDGTNVTVYVDGVMAISPSVLAVPAGSPTFLQIYLTTDGTGAADSTLNSVLIEW
jgi:hypothetical protein